MLNKLAGYLNEKGTRVTYSDAVLKHIAKHSYSEKFGARNMRRYIEREVEDRIASLIIDNAGVGLMGIHINIENGKIQISSI